MTPSSSPCCCWLLLLTYNVLVLKFVICCSAKLLKLLFVTIYLKLSRPFKFRQKNTIKVMHHHHDVIMSDLSASPAVTNFQHPCCFFLLLYCALIMNLTLTACKVGSVQPTLKSWIFHFPRNTWTHQKGRVFFCLFLFCSVTFTELWQKKRDKYNEIETDGKQPCLEGCK